jgi:hypothetical protein
MRHGRGRQHVAGHHDGEKRGLSPFRTGEAPRARTCSFSLGTVNSTNPQSKQIRSVVNMKTADLFRPSGGGRWSAISELKLCCWLEPHRVHAMSPLPFGLRCWLPEKEDCLKFPCGIAASFSLRIGELSLQSAADEPLALDDVLDGG